MFKDLFKKSSPLLLHYVHMYICNCSVVLELETSKFVDSSYVFCKFVRNICHSCLDLNWE